MYGSVNQNSEENMNDTQLELLVEQPPFPPEERRQPDLSIFRPKFTKNDWDDVNGRYEEQLKALKKDGERLWRIQEVEEHAQRIEEEGVDEVERELRNVGEKKLWKVMEDCDDKRLIGKAFVRGTERLWTKCLFEVQAKRIKESCEGYNLDPVQAMIKYWFKETKKDKKNKLLIPSLQHQITKLVAVLLEEECEKNNCVMRGSHHCKYGHFSKMWIEGRDTLMHLVAEENMPMLASQLIARFPGQINQRQKKGKRQLPIEAALNEFNDDVAAVIIKNMSNDRVRLLFQPDKMTGVTKLRFGDYIQREDMKKSVVAILDCMMKPDWPFIDEEDDEDEKDGAWSKIADIPIRYHVYYRMLDGDQEGRAPLDDGFNPKNESNFKGLLRSPNREIVIQHPVVRLLADDKWNAYGAQWVRSFALLYILFLASLSTALLIGASAKDPTVYQSAVDYFRIICEVVTLFAAVIYLILEIDQMIVERVQYLVDIYNYLDLFGIFLVFAIVPLRFYSNSIQWGVAASAFLVNFMRLFKYAPAWPAMGLYAKCLARMLFNDGKQFAMVYLVIMFAFGGSIFLALKGANQQHSVNGFGDIILREIRILTGGQSFSESYKSFNLAIVILILINMLVVLIMLVNMLIAHLSNVYGDAQNEAGIRFSIDKAMMVTKLEHSHFKNFRKDFYQEGAYISDMENLRTILDDWEKLTAEKNIGNLPNEAEKETIRKTARKDRFYGVML